MLSHNSPGSNGKVNILKDGGNPPQINWMVNLCNLPMMINKITPCLD